MNPAGRFSGDFPVTGVDIGQGSAGMRSNCFSRACFVRLAARFPVISHLSLEREECMRRYWISLVVVLGAISFMALQNEYFISQPPEARAQQPPAPGGQAPAPKPEDAKAEAVTIKVDNTDLKNGGILTVTGTRARGQARFYRNLVRRQGAGVALRFGSGQRDRKAALHPVHDEGNAGLLRDFRPEEQKRT